MDIHIHCLLTHACLNKEDIVDLVYIYTCIILRPSRLNRILHAARTKISLALSLLLTCIIIVTCIDLFRLQKLFPPPPMHGVPCMIWVYLYILLPARHARRSPPPSPMPTPQLAVSGYSLKTEPTSPISSDLFASRKTATKMKATLYATAAALVCFSALTCQGRFEQKIRKQVRFVRPILGIGGSNLRRLVTMSHV